MRLCVIATCLLLGAAPLAAQQARSGATETAVPVGAAPRGFGPEGATLRCRDGSYPAPGAADSACDGKGGVLVRFPLRPERPQPAAQPRPQAQPALRQAPARDTLPPAGFVPYAEQRRRTIERNEAARRPPDGATLLCKDGTFIVRDTIATRCQPHGGLTLRLSNERQPSP